MSTGSRVQSFPRAFPSSTDVPVLLLNQPNVSVRGFTGFACGRNSRRKADSCEKYIYINAVSKISRFVWTEIFMIVSVYKYDQNHFIFSFLSYLIR